MKRQMQLKAGLLGAVLLSFAFIKPSFAATSDSVDIHVSIAGTKSVLVQGTTSYDFGALTVAQSSVTVSSFSIVNNSTVFIETYTITGADAISATAGTNWTLASSTGTDQYALAAQFGSNSIRPDDNDSAWSSDDLTTSPQTCSSTVFGNGSAPESGSNVGVGEARALWFRLKTPGAVSDASQHDITVTISVQ